MIAVGKYSLVEYYALFLIFCKHFQFCELPFLLIQNFGNYAIKQAILQNSRNQYENKFTKIAIQIINTFIFYIIINNDNLSIK